uniref:Uncharacterized protein n=1 Tax=Strongyloides papillosus TaxID=174720 RepID=A0A0N5C5R8_STREA
MVSPQFGCFRYTLVIVCLLTVFKLNSCKNSDDLHQIKEMAKNYIVERDVNNYLPEQYDIYRNFDVNSLEKRKNEFIRFGKRKNEFIRFGKRNNVNYENGVNDQISRIYPIYDFIDINDVHKANKRKNEFIRFG